MTVRYRPLRPRDIPRFMEHFCAHPVLPFRYGAVLQDLPEAIKYTFRDDYVVVNIFEESVGSATRLIGAGMAAFVRQDFLRAAQTTPSFWLGPELVRRIASGNSPLLSQTELRRANSTGDLDLIVWHCTCHPVDLRRVEVAVLMPGAFEDTFRGFQLREIFVQADCLEHLEGMRAAGGLYFNRAEQSYGDFPEINERNFTDEPRNGGLGREIAMNKFASCTWVGSMFVYKTPKLGLNASEQRLLAAELRAGEIDQNLAHALGISLSAVKKAWRSIYERVARCMPELIGCSLPEDEPEIDTRGKQKKQRLLTYLREHPEELRPFSQKLSRVLNEKLSCNSENPIYKIAQPDVSNDSNV